MTILITGGTGYIGSHTVVQLLDKGCDVVVLDNLCNSSEACLSRIEQITGHSPEFYRGDILDREILREIFSKHCIDSVIHFAGLKAVSESIKKPLDYYRNNVTGSAVLLEEMQKAGVYKLIFSSSATVYGKPASIPISENFPVGGTTNPYGATKLMVEQLLCDVAKSDDRFSFVILRYFNPIGAHESGLIGEDPNDIPNNLLPYIAQVAVGKLVKLAVFGNDYPTKDGTGVRDYIHVVDLAAGHLKALDHIAEAKGVYTYNLGTGNGYSVLEIVKAFEQASGVAVPYTIAPRRDGDIAECYAEPSLARQELGWQAERGISEMMQDTWRWQKNNPKGYNR